MWARKQTEKPGIPRVSRDASLPQEDKQNTKHAKKGYYMIKPSKAVIAGAAVAGLLTGSFAVRAYAASTSGHAGVSLQTMADAEKGKHGCKGQNECKGQGGCKTGDNGCKGKNSCKGKGGCATEGGGPAGSPTPAGTPTPS
jgi:hypothetical protein